MSNGLDPPYHQTRNSRLLLADETGAYTLSYASGQWTWTDGTGRNTETYDYNGKILNSKDVDGNTLTYGYSGTLLTSVPVHNLY